MQHTYKMASEDKRPSSLYMDLKELRVHFDEVDTEQKGYIEYDGLQRMISNMEGLDTTASRELMTTLDRDGDGKVTFEDFQILFTLERDAMKEQRQQQQQFDDLSLLPFNSSQSSTSSGFVTAALYPQVSPRSSLFFSPDRPSSVYSRSLNQIPDSPDLSMHVRSLQKRSPSGSSDIANQRLSMGSEPGGDQVLEDTGTVGMTLSLPSRFSPTSNLLMGVELIEKELHSICPSDVVNREDVSVVCERLGIDATDEQEFLNLWDDLKAVSDDDKVTVGLMYDSIKQRETIAMVTSTPAANQPVDSITNKTRSKPTTRRWSKHLSMESFEAQPTVPMNSSVGIPGGAILDNEDTADHSQITSDSIEDDLDEIIDGNEGEEEEEEIMADDETNEWVDGKHFIFQQHQQHEVRTGAAARPSSAKEGSRLSKGGLSESSLRQTAMMQNFYSEFHSLQRNLEQVSQERDSLKQQLARVESEKKRLIQEGEESVLNLQRQNDAAIRKLEAEFNSKQRDLEASLNVDYRTHHENLEAKIRELKQKYDLLKGESESDKEDLKYYQSDNEKLVEKFVKLHNELKEKDDKISMFKERLGIPSDSLSDFDLELHSTRITELENELQIHADHNEGLRQRNTELQDQVDEWKAECEKIKQKLMEEKRKRQRRASDVTGVPPSQPTKSHGSRHHKKTSRPSRSSHSSNSGGRQLPLLPIPSYHRNNKTTDETDYHGQPMDGGSGGTADGLEQWMTTSDEESTTYDPSMEDPTADDIAAQSSTSLLEEMRVSDEQQNLITKIFELQNHSSLLEKNCVELQAQIASLEENEVALRNRLEQELRQKMHQKMKLDNRLKQLNSITKELATARKAVTDRITNSEEVLAQYLQGVENDINQLVVEDTISEMDLVQQLTREISTLKTRLHEQDKTVQKNNEDIHQLQGYINEQKKQLEDLQENNGALQHAAEQQSATISIIAKERMALENQYKQLEAKNESQERELKRTRAESSLAIHDLTKKESECSMQQEKVEKLEKELLRLHLQCDQYVSHIEDLKSHSSDKRLSELMDANSELQEKLNLALRNQTKDGNNDSDVRSPRVFSPDQSFASSVGQTEIVHQMKSQLELLQKVLIEKGTEEGSEVELSFVQELLQINTDLEENLMHQQQVYDQMVLSRDERIGTLEDLLAQNREEGNMKAAIASDDSDVITAAQIDEERTALMGALAAKEQEKQEEVTKLEDELNTQREALKFYENIIQKQKEEIERLNHFLGKARFKQMSTDTENEEMEKHIEEQKLTILSQSQLIEELKSLSTHNSEQMILPETDTQQDAELLTVKESLSTAEQLISEMRNRVLDLYQHVINPSDSHASDLLEFSELVNHLWENFDALNDELSNNKMNQDKLEAKLLSYSHDYDTLYSEHDEEVKAVQQQKDTLLLQLMQVEKKFESELNNQVELFESEQKKLKQDFEAKLTELKKDNESMKTALQKSLVERRLLQQGLETTSDKIDDLNRSKALLINLVQTISIQALTTLTSNT